ncbi:MAG: JAB domain-containing protein, partial [Acidobacteriota bacterium]
DVESVRRAEGDLTAAGVRGRQPPVDAEVGPRGELPSQDVFALRRADIDLDPERFQYKTEGRQAAGRALSGVEDWDYTKAGVMAVWWDPEAQRWFVVNGHNRMGLANRVLDEDEPVNVMELHVETPRQARALGAMINISEGRGTAVDAAKFFRDGDIDAEKVAELNIPMTENKVQKGLALSQLHPAIFDDVVAKRVKVNRAVIIGESGLGPEAQLAIHRSEDINELNQGELEELIRMARGAGTREVSQETLFGLETFRESNLLERVKISRRVKRELARDRRIFGPLADEARAQRIEAKQVGRIETEEACRIASEAERFEEVYNSLSTGSGPVADILNRHARAVGAGDVTLKEAADAATEEIKTALRQFLEEGGFGARAADEGAGVRAADAGGAGRGVPGAREGVPGGRGPGRAARGVDPELEEQRRLLELHSDRAATLIEGPTSNLDPRIDTSFAHVRSALRRLDEAGELTQRDIDLALEAGDEDFIEETLGRSVQDLREELPEGRSRPEPEEPGPAEEAYPEPPDEPRYVVRPGGGTPAQGRYHIVDTETDEVVARANYQDEAARQADELNREAGIEPPDQGPRGQDDLELFERAVRAYDAANVPDELARTVRQAESRRVVEAFGSEEAADRVADDVAQMSFDFADATVDGVPEAAARLRAVQEGAQRRAWVSVKGQALDTAEDVHRMLFPFRHPKAERLHYIYLDEAGEVLGHTMETSGSITTAGATAQNLRNVWDRARRLGASEVVLAHNHPSGSVRPSEEDRKFLMSLRAFMLRQDIEARLREQTPGPHDVEELRRRAGRQSVVELQDGRAQPSVDVKRGYVIDHDEIHELRLHDPDTPAGALPFVVDETHKVRPPPGARRDWTHQRGPRASSPRAISDLIGREGRADEFDLVFLDTQNRVVGIEPHTSDMLRDRPAEAVHQRARAHGASSVVFVTHGGNVEDYTNAVLTANRLRTSGDLETRALDVVAVEPGGSRYTSASGSNRLFETVQPDISVRRVFEKALPEGEEVSEAAVYHPGRDQWWTGGSHYEALEKVPDDVPIEELVDGYETTTGRFVGRREALALEDDTPQVQFGTSEEIRRSPSRRARERAERAKETFGTTDDPFEGGYILRDGTMLDFSGKRQGGSPGRRLMDHREINQAYDRGFPMDDAFAPVRRFMGEGNISLSVSDDLVSLRLSTRVTGDQVKAIQRAVRAMLDRRGRGRKFMSIDVFDPKSGEVFGQFQIEEPRPGAVGGYLAQVIREAEEAGYEPFNLRQLSRSGEEVTALRDADVVAPKTYPQAPESIATDEANRIREVARTLKVPTDRGFSEAVETAAEAMAPKLPPGARLIPIPSSRGDTRANRRLAQAIARRINGEVVDVLEREPQEVGSFMRRTQGEPGLTADEIRHELIKPPGDLENAYLVDNVVTTGATTTSARRALGEDVPVVAYAKDPDVTSRRELEQRARQAGRTLEEQRDANIRGVREEPARYGQRAQRAEQVHRAFQRRDFPSFIRRDLKRPVPRDLVQDYPRTMDEWREVRNQGRDPLDRFFFHVTGEEELRPIRPGEIMFLSREGPVGRAGHVYLVDKSKLDLNLLEPESTSAVAYTGPLPPDAWTRLGFRHMDSEFRVTPEIVMDAARRLDGPAGGGLREAGPAYGDQVARLQRLREGSAEYHGRARLRPAIQVEGRIFEGEPGEIHVDILNRMPSDESSKAVWAEERGEGAAGWVDEDGNWLSREQAARRVGTEGSLHADMLDDQGRLDTGFEVLETGGRYGQEDLFGGPAPPEGGEQFQMFPDRPGPLEGLDASEARAARTIDELQAKVDNETATGEELERYNEAVKLLRRNDPVTTEEIINRARQEAFEKRQRPRGEEDQTDIFGPEAGAALPKVLRQIAGAGTGGTIGALMDEENRWRGAAIGAVVGGGLVELPGAWTDVMAGRLS